MTNQYRQMLNDFSEDEIRDEYENVWGEEDGDNYTADELIEKMIAMDQALETRGF